MFEDLALQKARSIFKTVYTTQGFDKYQLANRGIVAQLGVEPTRSGTPWSPVRCFPDWLPGTVHLAFQSAEFQRQRRSYEPHRGKDYKLAFLFFGFFLPWIDDLSLTLLHASFTHCFNFYDF